MPPASMYGGPPPPGGARDPSMADRLLDDQARTIARLSDENARRRGSSPDPLDALAVAATELEAHPLAPAQLPEAYALARRVVAAVSAADLAAAGPRAVEWVAQRRRWADDALAGLEDGAAAERDAEGHDATVAGGGSAGQGGS